LRPGVEPLEVQVQVKLRVLGSQKLSVTAPLQRVPQVLVSPWHHWDLKVGSMVLGSIVVFCCAATKLAKTATTAMDLTNILMG